MDDLRKLKGQKSRQKIMNAAVKIIDEQGIIGLSTRTVADGAGLSQSSLYHHFEDLDTILLEAMYQRVRNVIQLSYRQPKQSLSQYFSALFEQILSEIKREHAAKGYATFMERVISDQGFYERMIKFSIELQAELTEKISLILGDQVDQSLLEYISFSLLILRHGFVSFMHISKGASHFSDPIGLARRLFGQLGESMEAVAMEHGQR